MRVVAMFMQRIGQVIGEEAAIARFPGFAAVRADINAADADADGQVAAVARVNLNRDRARMIAPGAEPVRIARGASKASRPGGRNRRRHR